MNNEPINFLPVNKFWLEEERRVDQRALWMLIGLIGGTLGTVLVAWLLIMARHGLTT